MSGSSEREAQAHPICIQVNGQVRQAQVSARTHLADLLRGTWGLTGTRLGCELGQCGACTVELNGQTARSCLTLAVQAHGAQVRTIEGMAQDPLGRRLQEAFIAHHAMQCGYCTAGMVIAARALLLECPSPTREQVRDHLSGHVCRCTGYESIVNAVMSVAETGGMS